MNYVSRQKVYVVVRMVFDDSRIDGSRRIVDAEALGVFPTIEEALEFKAHFGCAVTISETMLK